MNTSKFILPANITIFNRAEEVSSFGEKPFRKIKIFKDVHTFGSSLKLSKGKIRYAFGLLYFVSLIYFTARLFV